MKNFSIFIILPVLLTTLGELLLKSTINSLHLHASLSFLLTIAINPIFLFSVLCIILGGIFWLIGMSKFELSFMYPFLSLNYLLIIVGSLVYLKEKINLFTYLAIFFIIIGLIFISKSKNSIVNK